MPDSGWRERFVKAMREYPVVSHAAQFAGVSRKTAYEHRNSNPDFAADWDEAKQDGLDKLELLAYEKARNGDVGLLKWLLSCNRPNPYGERTRHEITGPEGSPFEVVLSWGNGIDKHGEEPEPGEDPANPGTYPESA